MPIYYPVKKDNLKVLTVKSLELGFCASGKMGSNGYFTDNIVAVHAMRRCL